MISFPKPKWLTLPETLSWLSEHGLKDSKKTKEDLRRAFYEGYVITRAPNVDSRDPDARCEVHSQIWDKAEINWDTSSLSYTARISIEDDPHSSYLDDKKTTITDIEVCIKSLSACIEIEPSAEDLSASGAEPSQQYISPFIDLMLKAAAALNVNANANANERVMKKNVVAWLRENWPKDLAGYSDSKIEHMATLIRRPKDAKGGNSGHKDKN
jgi:hypothetical protein